MPPLTSSLGTVDSTLGLSMVLGNPNAHLVQFELDAFNADPAAQAGRIVPINIVPADGNDVFCLGRDLPGLVEYLSPASYVEITQDGIDRGTPTTLAFQARTRGPKLAPPTGYSWRASLFIDDVEVASRTLYKSDPIDWDWKFNWGTLASGNHKIGFRLTIDGPAIGPPPAFPYLSVEIPAFYVDALTLTTDTTPSIANEVPAINQGISNGFGPPGTTSIVFDVFDVTAGGVNAGALTITVNGSPAIQSGAFQTGWSGTITGTSTKVLHVELTPASPFASSQIITVAVSAANHVPQTITKTWQFEIADTVPPVIYSVAALGTRQLRATWSKAVELDDPTLAHDALNPTLYTLAPIQPDAITPVVTPTIASVVVVSESSPSVIDIFTDVELTPGVQYQLTETGVADLVGNFTTSSIVFDSFVPPKPERRVWDLWRMLPQLNRQEDVTHDLKKFVACLQEVNDLLLYDIDRWTDILDVDVAPDPYLEAMLEDLGNPFPFVLDTNAKRRLIRLLVAIYKQKGTAPGIVNAVRFFLGLTVTVTTYTGDTMHLGISELGVDWILGPGNRFALYAFRVESGITLTADQRAKIIFIAKYMKPAHTHFIEIVEPTTPPVYDPVELGVSRLGVDWLLH